MGWGVPEARRQCYNSPMNSDLSETRTRITTTITTTTTKMPFLGRTLCRGPKNTSHHPSLFMRCVFHYVYGQFQIQILFWPISKKKRFGIAKRTIPVCLKYYILPQIYLRTPVMNIWIFQVDCLQLTAHGYLILLSASRSLVSQTRDLSKTLYVSGADGWYQCFFMRSNELNGFWILGAQKLSAK